MINLGCPGCGAPVSTATETCEFCQRPIVISTFSTVASMGLPELNKYAKGYQKALADNPEDSSLNGSVAMCFQRLGLYDQAIPAFEKAIAANFDNSELYFYNAVCLLRGKKAFKAMRETIDAIERLIQAAISIEPRGVYYYFHAYIKHDYFERKRFATSPSSAELMTQAKECGMHSHDAQQLFEILSVPTPDALAS